MSDKNNEAQYGRITAVDPSINTLSIGYFIDIWNNLGLAAVIHAGKVVAVQKVQKENE